MGVRSTLSLLTLLSVLLGCGGGDTSASRQFIPDVPLECTSGQAPACAGTGLHVFVGLVQNLVGSCEDLLAASLTSTERRESFAASGTATTSRAGSYMTATISSWVGPDGGAITDLDAGDYSVCAFIDTDGDDRVETNEPVGSGTLSVGSTGFVLSDWNPAFN